MATKKGAAAQKRQQYKSFVLSYLNDNEGPQRRDQILRDIKDQEKLTKDERNSLDQVIDSMIENAIVSLRYDEEQRECIELCDLTCTITKEKRKKPKPLRGKSKRFRQVKLDGPPPQSSSSSSSTMLFFDDSSDEESDEG
ncbi:uncharacterized protein [Penaeus vannamei]|uniref:uncharacterized protein n=1 Tax=Penaeus vannamei TaxID=6689 RepID=UPI00387F7CFA